MSMDIIHGQRTVAAGEFKQHCLALLDQVAETGLAIVVTKRGRPVARVVPIETEASPLGGSIRILAENEDDLISTGESWYAERDE